MIAIIGAMDEEIGLLRDLLQERTEETVLGVTLYQGLLEGVPVLLTQGGIGKVNAAKTATVLLLRGASSVIFTGVAGGVHPAMKVGDLVVSTDLIQHDVDVTPLGYDLGTLPGEPASWAADMHLRDLALTVAGTLSAVQVYEGRIASGDQFVASAEGSARLHELGAHCAEMEGAAVAQVCASAGVPFVVIRAISDTADHDAKVDYRSFFPQVAQHAGAVVRGMVRRLGAEQRFTRGG
ncbi:MAG: 5'-methylthioadenosine/adenosylhomocysteine nucleosidase [Deinococcus sp.]|nr:5'-methylthioadenosine/adenosylhomocysteine nucleosidase [Deinococcus sp.]